VTAPTPPIQPYSRGPKKPRHEGPPRTRLSTHKTRSGWFRSRTAWPLREAPVQRLVAARSLARRTLPAADVAARWEMAGPTNIGGRATCVAVHPRKPDRLWLGAAGGGVWRSDDAGRSWKSQWHDQDVLNVGALAVDPRHPDTIYCATGEANLSADSYPGVGLYRSTDGGATWTLHASVARTGIPRRIGAVAVDPFDSRHLVIGGVGLGETSPDGDLGGLYQSHDGGVTWTRATFVSTGQYWCHAVLFHPRRRGVVLVGVTTRGAESGLYRSTDGGATWKQITAGLPPPERIGRTSLALCASRPDVIVALASDALSDSSDLTLGVYRSENAGLKWKEISGGHLRREEQMSYGNTIAVHPEDPRVILCGGVDLHRTADGGRTWTRASRWDANRGTKHYAHADHHGLVMPAAAPGRVYDPNDGGLDVSPDAGLSWENRSRGLAITMFYDFDVAQSDGRCYGGGAQDNGSLATRTGRADDHEEVMGGDGGWMVYDPLDAGHRYCSCYNLTISRQRHGRWKDVSPPAPAEEAGSIWMCYIAMDPRDSNRVFTGTTRVWRTLDDGETWKPVSPSLDGGSITAIEIARADPRRVYVGTENGGLFRTLDGGKTWSANLAGGVLPGHEITRIGSDPADANVLWVTVANFGHSHMFRSRDGGHTWQDVDLGRLPDLPHHSLLVDPQDGRRVFVANDIGVFGTSDGGATWSDYSRDLPNAMVVDIAYQVHDRHLFAATYGRSVWRLRIG
jgi:photosystem II stability/assembly factor-like uncharacterized protein